MYLTTVDELKERMKEYCEHECELDMIECYYCKISHTDFLEGGEELC